MWVFWSAMAFATPADDAYLEALAAWNAGDWASAREGAAATLGIAPDHAPARLLEAFALVRMARMRQGMELLDGIVHDPALLETDPEVSMLAVHVIRRYSDRWRRDRWSMSAGPVWRDGSRQGEGIGLQGFAAELWLPASHRLGVRLGGTTPLSGQDALSLTGPIWDALAVWQQPIGSGVWHADAALGPSVWTGRSDYWEDRYRGLFPGARGAVGLDWRVWQSVGFRVEGGFAAHYGARQGLDFWSTAFDLRVMTTGVPR